MEEQVRVGEFRLKKRNDIVSGVEVGSNDWCSLMNGELEMVTAEPIKR